MFLARLRALKAGKCGCCRFRKPRVEDGERLKTCDVCLASIKRWRDRKRHESASWYSCCQSSGNHRPDCRRRRR